MVFLYYLFDLHLLFPIYEWNTAFHLRNDSDFNQFFQISLDLAMFYV